VISTKRTCSGLEFITLDLGACPLSSRQPVTVLVDTREQAAYSFDARLVVAERRPLPSGDYSVVGLEGVAPGERKTLDDGDAIFVE